MAMRRVNQGDRVGEYVLEERVGAGDQTEVWRGRHHILNSRAAVKVALTDSAAQRLRQAGLGQYTVKNERVLRTLGLNLEHDPPYLLTEYVAGTSLRGRLENDGAMPFERTQDLFRDLLAALDAIHAEGRCHGNLKPENILIDDSGRAFLTDFGGPESAGDDDGLLSGVFDEGRGATRLLSAYHAPDARGAEPAPAHDVWAAGLILFECLTGRMPQGSEVPGDVVPGLPAKADEVFRKSYVRPERRYTSAAGMAEDLFREADAAPEEPDELVARIVSVETVPAEPVAPVEEIRILSSVARCRSCGHRNPVDYKFCVRCGTPLSLTRMIRPICDSCGRPRRDKHRFCPFCGGRYRQ